jgi:hypothetical protein
MGLRDRKIKKGRYKEWKLAVDEESGEEGEKQTVIQ